MSASGTPVLVGGLRSWTARIDQPPSGQHSPYHAPDPSGSVLFPTHIVIAYLLARRLDCSLPWTVAGAMLPDLIDKPLGRVGETDRYHSVAHSLLSVAVARAGIDGTRAARSLWLGWASHIGADAAGMGLNGRSRDLAFLLWPIGRERPYSQLPDGLPLPGRRSYVRTRAFAAELAIWVAAGAVALGAARDA